MTSSKSLYSTFLVLIGVLLMLLSAGCAAIQPPAGPVALPPQVPESTMWVLSNSGTVAGIQGVLTGTLRSGMVMLSADGQYMAVIWPIQRMGWASLFVDIKNLAIVSNSEDLKVIIGQAGIANSKVMADFVTMLMDNGFENVDPKQLPTAIATALSNAGFFNSIKMAPVMVMPAGMYKSVNDLYPVEIQQ